jgi:A/G-specific adenine glycosylase
MAVSKAGDKSPERMVNNFRKKILAWYDAHQRALPWRAPPGRRADPYHVWLSEIMLQQTTVATVGPYFQKFVSLWPTVHDLAAADREKVMKHWAGLGYYARARNLHKCAGVVANDYNGKFPEEQAALKELPGIGDYTSAAISAIAFGRAANVVDGNIERVMARIFAVEEPLPASKKRLKELAGILSENREDRPGDYAQALMDLGATICTPTSPKCLLCPVNSVCEARARGIEASLPRKEAKKPKPHKTGQVYWITNENEEVLLEQRGENVMLGGMNGLPTSEWTVEKQPLSSLYPKAKPLNAQVLHSFTHFDLTLDIYRLPVQKSHFSPENNHFWMPLSKITEAGLPTLFKKVANLLK